jgi:Ser/Thr protein kinase RdoA (MazF antagonist)
MDVAMLVFDSVVLYAGEDKDTFARRFLQSFLKGYRPENRLDAFWLRQMPDFLKLLEIGAYAEAYKFYEAGDAGEWGRKFMPGRKARIENGVPYLNVDFERC